MDINNIVNSTRIRNARLLDDINNKILNREYYKFKYLPLEGALPGLYFQQQTEDAINDIGNVAYATEQVADEALKIAQQAYNIALAALETANNALAAAQTAQQTANTALNIAKNALSVGTAAATAAAAAQKRADEAYDLADAAKKAADAAKKAADAAQNTANSAANDATNALTKAESALTKIEQLSVLNYYNNVTEATDVNTLVDIRRWYLQASNNPNAPETNPGFLNVDNDYNDSVCKQLWVSETTGAIYNRFGQIVENSDPATVSSWSEWYKLATKADIDGTTTDLTKKITTVANNLATHEADFNNPHKVTAEQLGLTTVYQYKGSVATYANLPTTGQKVGDVWNIETADPDHGIKAGDNVAWDGAQWDILGGNQDLSGYAQLNSANTFTALNTFRANIRVSNGTAAGSQGQIILGNKPQSATVQANIISSTTGALNYIATENTGHYFKIGNNTASTSITTNESKTAILSHNAFEFARITNVGVAKWLGNANTATKLETARTINGVAFDGTANITIADSTKLPIAGGTMTGDLTLKGNPTADLMAATKKYVDDSIAEGTVYRSKSTIAHPLQITEGNTIGQLKEAIVTLANKIKLPSQVAGCIGYFTCAETWADNWTNDDFVLEEGQMWSVEIVSINSYNEGYWLARITSYSEKSCYIVSYTNLIWGNLHKYAFLKDVTSAVANLQSSNNTWTGSNVFKKNIAVSNGTTAGSQGQIILGNKPQSATVQANIISSTTGALNYIATENTGHYFKIGNNTASTSITTNESKTAILSHNAFEFARITNVGVAKWLGNANTATKLETARTINGVAFDGTKDITIEASGGGDVTAAGDNNFTGTNTFNKPITVRDGALAGIGGTIILGTKPNSATTQAKINSTTTGAMYYTATEGLAHFFNVGTAEVATIGGTATTATLDFLSNNILKYSTSSGLRVGGGGTSKIIGFYPEAADNTAGMRLSNQAEAISTDYSIFSLQNNSAISYTKNAALQVGNFKILEVDRNNNNVTIKADSNGQILFTPNNLASNTSSIDSDGNFYISQSLTVGSTLNTGMNNGVIQAGNNENCLYFTGTAENTWFSSPNTGDTVIYQSRADCYLINCSITNPSSFNMDFSHMNFKALIFDYPHMWKTLTIFVPVGATVPAVTWRFPTGSEVYYPKGVAPTLTANANNIINIIAIMNNAGRFSIQVCDTVVLPYSG